MKLNLKEIQKLKQKKYRTELAYVFVEGEHLIDELEKTNFSNIELIKTNKSKFNKSRFRINEIDQIQFDKLSSVKNNQGIGAIVPLSEFSKIVRNERFLVFDRIQDPSNLGNIIRQAAWFGGFTIILSEGSVDCFNEKVVRGSMGGIFHVPIIENVKLLEFFDDKKVIAMLDMEGQSLKSANFPENNCFLFGNEATGIDPILKKTIKGNKYTINGTKQIESLNLSTSVAIVLYELSSK
jgi:RNA methyltransferase, TrmH family